MKKTFDSPVLILVLGIFQYLKNIIIHIKNFFNKKRDLSNEKSPFKIYFNTTYLIDLPIATAVSSIRLEKPHSLSYHETIRTKFPSITFVSFKSKVDEAGL